MKEGGRGGIECAVEGSGSDGMCLCHLPKERKEKEG